MTEGDTVEGALARVGDGLSAVLEIYEDLWRPLLMNARVEDPGSPVWFETQVVTPERR